MKRSSTFSRILCVRVPSFAVVVANRQDSARRGCPLVVGVGVRGEAVDVSPEAAEAGVQHGMSRIQAEAVCPDLLFVDRQGLQLEAASAELQQQLRGISPQVEPEGDGVFFLGCRGLERLYGAGGRVGLDPEQGLMQATGVRLQEQGWPLSMGLADTRFVAFAAAVCGDGAQVVSVRGGRRYLQRLPLGVLPLSRDLVDRLSGLGLKTLGEFADLPAPTIEARYGAEGIHFHHLARGEDQSALLLTVPDEVLRQSVDVLAYSVAELEAPVKEAVQHLLTALGNRGRTCASLAFTFELENGDQRELEISTATPTLNPRVFWDLLLLALQNQPFSDRVSAVHLEVRRERRGSGRQGVLFAADSLDGSLDERRDAALGWLVGLYGEEAVVRPGIHETHRPERRMSSQPRGVSRPRKRQPPAVALLSGHGKNWIPGPGLLSPVLRLLDPPAPLEVQMDGERLLWFAWVGGRHRVRAMVGPQRLSGEWWDEPYERDYYEALTHEAGMYWLFYGRSDRQWFLQGLFD